MVKIYLGSVEIKYILSHFIEISFLIYIIHFKANKMSFKMVCILLQSNVKKSKCFDHNKGNNHLIVLFTLFDT